MLCWFTAAGADAPGDLKLRRGIKTMKKLLAILLALSLLMVAFSCAAAEAAPETRTVTDVWNREVEIPGEVDSIVCLGSFCLLYTSRCV